MTNGVVKGIVSNLVTVEVDGPVPQNEICHIIVRGAELMSEVIKVIGTNVYVQVFESTRGTKVGDRISFTRYILEVTLGPGMLSKNYDGLQRDLDKMDGVFLKRGDYTHPLDMTKKWDFTPIAKMGDTVQAGSWLGQMDENYQLRHIMVLFIVKGSYMVKSTKSAGQYTVEGTIAVIVDVEDKKHDITMIQHWPVKVPIQVYSEEPRPLKLLKTDVRTIDTLNPIVEGGTGLTPGPFGTGKTVLQYAILRQAEADVVIMAACGERVNEVMEIFAGFPEFEDPYMGRKPMKRTIIVANTSNVPVAACETSIYTAITIAEHCCSMGLRVLLVAGSISRRAQALREMLNRLEELPGPDTSPVDLSAIATNFYARAGLVYPNNGEMGSTTFIGTVSSVGDSLKKPVMENTKKVAQCFYALEQECADSKCYPAVNPTSSYSKHIEYLGLKEYITTDLGSSQLDKVNEIKIRMQRGKEIAEQINILGDDGAPVEYHVIFWESELIDFVVLQQDALDDIDCNMPLERQRHMLDRVIKICYIDLNFEDLNEVGTFFKMPVNHLKQMNYSELQSEDFKRCQQQHEQLIEQQPTHASSNI